MAHRVRQELLALQVRMVLRVLPAQAALMAHKVQPVLQDKTEQQVQQVPPALQVRMVLQVLQAQVVLTARKAQSDQVVPREQLVIQV